MAENAALLRNYVETASNEAFGQLVARHFDLVYSAALRLVGGDAHLAQDVAQTVFTDLARKAKAIPQDALLGGWLYQHTRFIASKAVRTERRRHARERQAVEMNAQNEPSDAVWRQLAPLLEEAMGRLSAADRNAIVLRYFEHRPFRGVGDALGVSEDGARKRVERALEQLRSFFGRRGLSVSAVSLAEVLNSQAVAIAPVGLAASITTASLAVSATNASVALPLIKLMAITKLKIAAGALAAGMAATIVLQYNANTRLRDQNRALREQSAQLDGLRAENEKLAQMQKTVAQPLDDAQLRELLRLRGEVGGLKTQLAEAVKARDKAAEAATLRQRQSQANADVERQMEEQKQAAISKMNFSQQWMLAFHLYAGDNQGQFPTNFDQAASYLSRENAAEAVQATNLFEIVNPGLIANMSNAAQIIVLREKQPWQGVDGGWVKTYGFADGHSEVHKAVNGSFEPWETDHLPKLKDQ